MNHTILTDTEFSLYAGTPLDIALLKYEEKHKADNRFYQSEHSTTLYALRQCCLVLGQAKEFRQLAGIRRIYLPIM